MIAAQNAAHAPPISVLMSVYNGQDYLAEAIDSILAQTFANFEFIIFDDGSTDRSIAIVQEYAARDPRIVFHANQNKGLTATLNEAAKMARGEFLARMDPDDVALPRRFEKQLAFMRQHADITCLGSRVVLIDPYGVAYQVTDHPLTHAEIDRDLMRGLGWAIVHPVAFIRRSAFEQVGGYNEKYRTSQDMELWLRLAEHGKLANLEEPLLQYRQHLASANFAKADQQKKLKLQIMAAAYARRGLPFDPTSLPPPPLSDPFQSRRRWGWAAIATGQNVAARKHALAMIKLKPAHPDAWKMLLLSYRRPRVSPVPPAAQVHATGTPKISVLLPAYNAQRYIASAVQSILDQTFTEFEFIIVNDGSTDGTGQILQEFAQRDARIHLISRPNTGYFKALVEAAALARGEYLARMDGDDLAAPSRFAKQVALLNARPEVVVVGTSYDLIDAAGRKLRTQRQPTDDAALQRDCLAGTTPLCHPTTMFRRSAFERVGGYDEALFPAEDLDLWLRLGEIGKLACLPESLLRYRLHVASVSETQQTEQVAAARRAVESASRRRNIPVDFKADAGWRETGPDGQFKQKLKYGWWAFSIGERSTARSYGIEAIRARPFNAAGWKLLVCTFVKRVPRHG